MKKTLNLVYDNWDNENNVPLSPNCSEFYYDESIPHYDNAIRTFKLPEEDIKRYRLCDIECHPNENFYYFINTMPNKIVTNYMENNDIVPIHILEYLKSYKNFNIVFINTHEIEHIDVLSSLDNWSKDLNINQEQLWLVNNESKLKYYKEILNTKINVHSSKRMLSFTKGFISTIFKNIEFKPDKNEFFMCYNKRCRSHRLALLSYLKKYNILTDDFNWSLIDKYNVLDNYYLLEFLNKDDIDNISPEIDFFSNIEHKSCKYEKDNDWNNDNVDMNINLDVKWNSIGAYENSYFNIITESEYASEYIHITEKSFKPFYCMQFPLILASPNHIKEIKESYNLDFFDDIINHDYDKEKDHRKRFFKFIEEVKRINENKEFFINFYKNNKQRFLNNHKKIVDDKYDFSDLKFIQNLIYKKIDKPKGIMYIGNLDDKEEKNLTSQQLYSDSFRYKEQVSQYLKSFKLDINNNITEYNIINEEYINENHSLSLTDFEYVLITIPPLKNCIFSYTHNDKNYTYVSDCDRETKVIFYEWILENRKIPIDEWYNNDLPEHVFNKLKDAVYYYRDNGLKIILICETNELLEKIKEDSFMSNRHISFYNNKKLYTCIDDLKINDNDLLLNNIITQKIIQKIKEDKLK